MLKYYFSFLLIILHHALLISVPTCHITFDQTQQNSHTTVPRSKPFYYNHSYDQTDKLLHYSSTQLQEYFNYHYYSEKEILSQNTLYLSNEFVELAKTYPSYEKTITTLHKKFQRMWIVQKAVNYIIHGSSYSQFLKRLDHLYHELRSYKQIVTANAISFAQLYDIHLLALFPHNDSFVTKNIYKNYIDILHRAYHIPPHNFIIRDCIGQASRIGLEANKNGHTKYATQLADFCLTILDYTAACGEGIYLGVKNSINAITHPIETVKNGLLGIGIIAHGLSKLVSVPIECTFLYVTNKDHFYIQKNNIINQLEMIIDQTTCYVKTTPTREVIKQGSALITEGMVLTKICSFAHTISKQLLPVAHNYFEYIAKNEPAACLANETITTIEIPKNIEKAIKEISYFEVNEFKFTKFYYERLWQTGREAPSLAAKAISENATKVIPDPRKVPGFFKYFADGWEMIYNPTTKVVAHIQPLK